jgi:hypothetical protein
MEGDKYCGMGFFIIINFLFGLLMNLNTNAFWNEKWSL